MRSCLALLASLCLLPAAHAAKNLEIYFIDVEGGQATLIVAPSGESMLVDAGWAGFGARDAQRIISAAKSAHVKKIDYVLITHFHADHAGGAANLAERIPIGTFVDHGSNVETTKSASELDAAYAKAIANSKRMIAKPGDKIPLKGVDVEVVTSNGDHIQTPLPGAGQPNAACSGVEKKANDASENARSLGFVLTYGSFKFVDLGDLTWNKELELVCPNNLRSIQLTGAGARHTSARSHYQQRSEEGRQSLDLPDCSLIAGAGGHLAGAFRSGGREAEQCARSVHCEPGRQL